MGLFDKFFKKENEPTQRKEAPKVMFNKLNAYSSKTNRRYKDYAKDGYQENAIVHRCIQLISNSASAVKIDVFDDDIKLDNHELISLLERPNPLQSGVEYFASLYSFLLISGNSYLLRDTESFTPPRELYLLRPDRVEIDAGESMIPQSYRYVLEGRTVAKYPVDPKTGGAQVKQIKLWSPLDDFYGLSPIMASAYNIDQHNLAGMHNVALLKNGCTPSGMLKFEPTDETGMSTQLTDDQRARLLEDLEFRFQGTHNSGRPMLLEGNFSYQQLGLNPKDMDFLELLNLSAREIALCFGVPAQLIGIPDSQTYSNMETAKLALYEETVIPLLKRVESDLNEYLAPLYEGDIRIQYDMDSIPAMVEKRKSIYENVVAGVQAGILTRNEARDRLGLEEISGGDDLYIPSNLFPIGEADTSSEDNAKPVTVDEAEKGYDDVYGTKDEVGYDTFTTEGEALDRADEIGCVGTHSHEQDGRTVYMPCRTHAEYERQLTTNKAISDLDLTPSDGMAEEAKRGLEWRKEFGRGGTQVGVARANQLVGQERLSPNTVLRMYSFFSRHEVDKQAEGFERGEDGYPSAGRIAWALWGGDAGFSWSKTKRDQIMRERAKSDDDFEYIEEACINVKRYHDDDEEEETKAPLSASVKKGLQGKVDKHNEKYGDKKGKRVTLRMLGAVFRRGVGAYRTNPSSVRPSVRARGGEDRWAYARVNAFLVAVRTGKFRSGKFDLDLLPSGHPLKSN
jgi:HK97 family phage portal protein